MIKYKIYLFFIILNNYLISSEIRTIKKNFLMKSNIKERKNIDRERISLV